MPTGVRQRLGDSFVSISYVLAALLLCALLGRFSLDYWMHSFLQNSEQQQQQSFALLQNNQNLLIKTKNIDLAFQGYLHNGLRQDELRFKSASKQATALINQLIEDTANQPTQAIYSRASNLLEVLLVDMGDIMSHAGNLHSQSKPHDDISITGRNLSTTDLGNLLTFVTALEDERERLLREKTTSLQNFAFALNGLIALLTVALLTGLIYGLRRHYFRPIKLLGQKMDEMDESAPSTITLETHQPEISRLLKNFNQLISRVLDREQSLAQAQAKEVGALNEALKEKIEYSGVLAHEIRTPLNTIMGMLRLMQQPKNDQNDDIPTLENAYEVASDLHQLVNSTLEYTRYNREDVLPNLTSVNAGTLIDEITKRFMPLANKKLIMLHIERKGFDQHGVVTDPIKLKQVLSNLLDNALKFTKAGGTVSLTAQLTRLNPNENTGTLCITVSDTGIGIAPEALSLIFQPFKQANSGIKRKFGGTGIGLALSKSIVKSLGGEIRVDSTPDVGTKFTVTLPVDTTPKPNKHPLSSTPWPSSLSGKHALMVEDHAMNAKINIKLFEKIGITFDWADTGEKALATYQHATDYDFVLMDINLGEGLSGLDVTEQLHHRFGADCPPIFAFTAGVVQAQRQAMLDTGITDIIGKPFTLEEAVATITTALQARAHLSENTSHAKP